MKRRFIITIGLVLAISLGAMGFLQYVLFRAEQFRLIDKQIETSASLLISSDLSSLELQEFEEAEKVVENVVGGEKLNQFVIVINRKGKIIYQSENTQFLPDDLPRVEKWQTIEHEGHFIRVLTVPLERQHVGASKDHRILQTGLILDADLLRWRTVGKHLIIYSALVIVVVLLTTWFLARSLLRPLNQLAKYLRFMGNQFDEKQIAVGADGGTHAFLPAGFKLGNDEFGQLVQAAQSLNQQIRQSLRTTQVWTAQMAHEIKTPLTILHNTLDAIGGSPLPSEGAASLKAALGEIGHLNLLINSFLEWTSVENFSGATEELHAIRLKVSVEETVERLNRLNSGRIQVDANSDLVVFASPGFVHQAISNLLVNSLKYSQGVVQVHLAGDTLLIEDAGPGIPKAVLDNLGQPFNYGQKNNHGFGLGLAWVTTICRKYDWKLSFENIEPQGTRARIIFPVT